MALLALASIVAVATYIISHITKAPPPLPVVITEPSQQDISGYQGAEQKAAEVSLAFLEAMSKPDYTKAFSLMGDDLQSSYSSGPAMIQEEASKASLNQIYGWKITSVVSALDSTLERNTITVQGTLKAKTTNANGTFIFKFYLDPAGSLQMYEWGIIPSL